MKLTLKETLAVMKDVNVEAAKISAKQEIGGVINDRLIGLVQPRLPLMVRGYAETPLGKAALANLFAAAAVQFFADNDKVALAAEAAVYAAMQDLVQDFDFRGMINDLLDGIDLTALEKETKTDKEV
jgi:hypothetical protein